MNVVAWRGAGGKWSLWHFERAEYPYSLYCRATLPTGTATMRKKLVAMTKICRECRRNLYLEKLKHEHHSADR